MQRSSYKSRRYTSAGIEKFRQLHPDVELRIDDKTYPATQQPVPAASPPPAVAPFDAATAKQRQETWAKHLGTTVEKNGGQFYTPRCLFRVLVEMLAPYKGRVYDPCCGSTGMFVQSEIFAEEHGRRIGDIAVYGQESNSTTRRLAMMNLAIRGIEWDPKHADGFRCDLHKDLKTDCGGDSARLLVRIAISWCLDFSKGSKRSQVLSLVLAGRWPFPLSKVAVCV